MVHDFSFENTITDGIVQIIRSFTLDFDKITILFENCNTKMQKELKFSRVISLTMLAVVLDDYDSDMDIMAYRTLIGFSYEKAIEKIGTVYTYVLVIDDYEIVIKSLNFVELATLSA